MQKKLDIVYDMEIPALSDDCCLIVDLAIAKLPRQQRRAVFVKHLTYAPVKDKARGIRVGVKRFHELVMLGYRRIYSCVDIDI